MSKWRIANRLSSLRYRNAPPLMVALPGFPSVREPRGALLAKVKIGGMELLVANTHLGTRRAERMARTRTLLGPEWLEQPEIRELPTILLGDFNAVPRSPVYRLVTQSFQVAQPVRRGGRAATFPARLPLIRIDHIFVRNGLAPRDTEVPTGSLPKAAPDHLPVLTLALPR